MTSDVINASDIFQQKRIVAEEQKKLQILLQRQQDQKTPSLNATIEFVLYKAGNVYFQLPPRMNKEQHLEWLLSKLDSIKEELKNRNWDDFKPKPTDPEKPLNFA